MHVIRNFHRGRAGYRCLQEAVSNHYFKHYNANPVPTPDFFMCLTGDDGAAPGYACAGITYGDTGKLFSEYYLKHDLDELFCVQRSRILEIGSFSSFQVGTGAGTHLLKNIVRMLTLYNYGLVVMTVTDKVYDMLQSFVEDVVDLGLADINKVKKSSIDWGTYYEQHPRVVAFRVDPKKPWTPSHRLPSQTVEEKLRAIA
jgi:hypothetical protein